MSVSGAQTYQLIRNLVAPGKTTGSTLRQLVELVQAHYCPKPSAIVQHFTFNMHKEGETVAEFVVELRWLTEYCEFGTTLDDMFA